MLRWRPTSIIVSCEHAGAEVPAALRKAFRGQRNLLKTHRGHDIGAFGVAVVIASELAAPLYAVHLTRLAIDVNRSLSNRAVFSEISRPLPIEVRERLIERPYRRHRDAVEAQITRLVTAGERVLHLGMHSFTPELDGKVREVDIGLLFDPARGSERTLCRAWRTELEAQVNDDRVRLNQPYKGVSDGFTTYLRTRFHSDEYAGVEIEVKHSLVRRKQAQARYGRVLVESLQSVISGSAPPAESLDVGER